MRRVGAYSNQNSIWQLDEPYLLKPRKNTSGYLRVMFSIENKHYDRYVHRIVAKEFCKNYDPNKYKEVNHIDGNKENNIDSNLEWCDRSYNNKHSYIKGLHTLNGCYGKKKLVAQIDISTGEIIKIHESVISAAEYVGLKACANISACCNYVANKNKYKRPCLSAKGYKWAFATENMKVGDIL